MTLPLEIDLAAFDTIENAMLVDCRTPEERLEAAIPDQAFVPMDEASARIEDFKSWEDQGTVVIYCRSGRRSLNLTVALREAGVENVCSLAGGIQAWISEGREVHPKS
ncbi:MAG: rhodanese-like domain-containing protein [Planctomycetota bacterium]|jgi:rhodanese-related sulfurtransferase